MTATRTDSRRTRRRHRKNPKRAAGVALRAAAMAAALALLAAASDPGGAPDLRVDPLSAMGAKAACAASPAGCGGR